MGVEPPCASEGLYCSLGQAFLRLDRSNCACISMILLWWLVKPEVALDLARLVLSVGLWLLRRLVPDGETNIAFLPGKLGGMYDDRLPERPFSNSGKPVILMASGLFLIAGKRCGFVGSSTF